jgi:hypothetical protein
MTPKQRKRILFDNDLTISGLAREFRCSRVALSYCINEKRVYPNLRTKLAFKLGYPEEILFPAPRKSKVA